MIRFPGKGGLQKVEIHPCPTYRSTGQDSCRRPDRVIVAEQVLAYSGTDFHRTDSTPLRAYIGVEKSLFQTLPSLRTVRAVLPHTALQSIVSSSGSARFRMGFVHCEKSQAREVGIGPLLMVLDISSRSPSLLLILPQNTS